MYLFVLHLSFISCMLKAIANIAITNMNIVHAGISTNNQGIVITLKIFNSAKAIEASAASRLRIIYKPRNEVLFI